MLIITLVNLARLANEEAGNMHAKLATRLRARGA